MAVVSKWICGSCVAKDVLFAVHTGRETVFVICAACGATQFSPERGDAEFIQMDGTARELTGNWVMATHEVVRSAGYESQFDVEVWHFTKGSLKVFLALEYEICDPTMLQQTCYSGVCPQDPLATGLRSSMPFVPNPLIRRMPVALLTWERQL
ncbi:hypothetical protein ACN9MU_06895 [Pseudoduganella sp. R-32]|uniref:hypothetical protein n=1 Tax=Pseudoduganella sp. R-32 TaxID=3404061 RepID=UPI003CF68B14